MNFAQYQTNSWAKVQTANSIWDQRVKDAVSSQMAAKGWTEDLSGGDVVLTAHQTTHKKQDFETFYDGFGSWRWGEFGNATTTVDTYKVGTRVVDGMWPVAQLHS